MPRWPLRIYYDASCPLCERELQVLVANDVHARLQLRDCSAPGFTDADAERAGFTPGAMMQRIHARDADGNWLVGVPVFEAAYRAVGIGSIARLWGSDALRPLWDALYGWIADHRMSLARLGLDRPFGGLVGWLARRAARRARCDAARCALPPRA